MMSAQEHMGLESSGLKTQGFETLANEKGKIAFTLLLLT